MKYTKYSLILISLLIHIHSLAQPVKKPVKPKDTSPTQKEMDDLLKQADEILNNLTPEQKRIYDSLGGKSMKSINAPRFSDKELAAAYEDEMRVVPARKTALINTIPKVVLSKPELLAFVRKTSASIASLIKPESKLMADKLDQMFEQDPYYGYMIASTANGLWMMGYKESATYLMSKAASEVPNADNLNNLAAYLTMGGAAHIAIPILDKLNSVHPNNSTILNNLGQAWLQLGEESKAEQYLDAAISIYKSHPQANYTKCLLMKSRGRNAEAVAALKRSMEHSVTEQKINQMRDLMGPKYVDIPFYAPRVYYSTTFDLHQYLPLVPDAYATELGSNIEEQWKEFREAIKAEITKIEQKMGMLAPRAREAEQEFFKRSRNHNFNVHSPYHRKAVQRWNSFRQDYQRRQEQYMTRHMEFRAEWLKSKQKYEADLAAEFKRFEGTLGQGSLKGENCEGKLPIINKFLNDANGIYKKMNKETLAFYLTEYYNMYYYMPSTENTDEMALLQVLTLRAGFLGELYNLAHESDLGYPCADEPRKQQEYSILKPLKDYDEINCSIRNTINTPGLGQIVMRCNTMSMRLNPILLPFDASLTANFDGFIEEASVGITVKEIDINAGAKFDKDGNFKEGEISAGMKALGVKVEEGVVINKDGNIKEAHTTMSTELAGIGISSDLVIDKDGLKKGSVELGIDKSLGLLPKDLEDESPVEIGLKNQLGASLELTRQKEGIVADFSVKNEAKLDFATKLEVDNEIEMTPGMISKNGTVTEPEKIKLALPSAPSITVNADSRWSVNSGYSAKGSSSLSKLK